MDFAVILSIAFATGVILGFLFEKGQFCMTLMLTESVFFNNHRRVVGLIGAIITSMVLFNLAVSFGLIDRFNLLRAVGVSPNFFQPPLVIERGLLGGLLFGFGMILAGGCVAGILFRIGEGQLSSVVAFLGLMAGFATAMMLEVVNVIGPEFGLYPPGVLLPQILHLPTFLVVAVIAAFLVTLMIILRRNVRTRNLVKSVKE